MRSRFAFAGIAVFVVLLLYNSPQEYRAVSPLQAEEREEVPETYVTPVEEILEEPRPETLEEPRPERYESNFFVACNL